MQISSCLVSICGELRAADHLDCDCLEGHLELLGVLAGAVVEDVVHQVHQVQLRRERRVLLCHPVGRRAKFIFAYDLQTSVRMVLSSQST